MCFGLRNAAQTFQRYSHSVIRDLDFCYAYLDDILVASPDEDSHRRDLERLFQCLSKNEIIINPDKCVYGQTQLSYLGFHISAAVGDTNVVADPLSRISENSNPGVDFQQMALAQTTDEELQTLLKSNTGLKLQLLPIDNECALYCDTSTNRIRPYVPLEFRKRVFDSIHSLSNPGTKATLRLLRYRYVWKNMARDTTEWCRACLDCQKSKVFKHTKTPLGSFKLIDTRFTHVNIDVVGPLPPSRNNRYLPTCIDRFTRWVEAVPMVDQAATTITQAFLQEWVSRFGVPEVIITDRGTNFQSNLFHNLANLLGSYKNRSTAYNPKANGMIERVHRQIKATLMAHSTADWVGALPLVLLGIGSGIKLDIGASSVELVYGTSLRLPGEFF
ncbi:Retrovirus-related Pol polyprotein from transposon 412 [Araneus ventricosus]|uniref:RNA-directed DNA polymerase n=1 Tax=Araneus ventricosus TaxID=182803 RepID=A0A4Y2KKD1_ARAVE|nr:Retrovirus-related Pol polyprotein from transposon 412 [Araneus ventricosus]